MPASMMSDEVGLSVKVIGKSIAIVAVGPMPGSTPIRVPKSTPIRQYIRLSGDTATWKPIHRLLRSEKSMASYLLSVLLEGFRPDGERKLQSVYEDGH